MSEEAFGEEVQEMEPVEDEEIIAIFRFKPLNAFIIDPEAGLEPAEGYSSVPEFLEGPAGVEKADAALIKYEERSVAGIVYTDSTRREKIELAGEGEIDAYGAILNLLYKMEEENMAASRYFYPDDLRKAGVEFEVGQHE